MTATVGSQLFGPWYDILGSVLISGMFFYLAFATPTLALSVKNRMPAFLSKRFCLVLAFGAAAMAVFQAVNMHSPEDALPDATSHAEITVKTSDDGGVIVESQHGLQQPPPAARSPNSK